MTNRLILKTKKYVNTRCLHSLKKCLLLQCNMINNASWDKNCCMPHKYQTEQNIIFTYCIFYYQSCLFNILFVVLLSYIKLSCGLEEIGTDKKIRNPPYFFVAIYICVLYRLSIYYQLTKSYFRSVCSYTKRFIY